MFVALGQLESFLPPPWYMKIDSNYFININMLYDNLGNEISYVVLRLYALTGYHTTSYKFNVRKVHVFKKCL